MKTRTIFSTIASLFSIILLLAMVQSSLAAAPDPTPTDLGVLEGCVSSQAIDINSEGQIIGFSTDENGYHLPFVWHNGIMTKLPLPDGYIAGEAVSINNNGIIAGHCQTVSGVSKPYSICRWTMTEGQWQVETLDLPITYSYDSGKACKINNNDQILCVVRITGYGAYTNAAILSNNSWTVLTFEDNLGYTIPVTVKYDIYTPATKSPTMNDNAQVLFREKSTDPDAYSYDNDLWVWDNGKLIQIVTRIICENMNNSGQIVGRHVAYFQYSGGSLPGYGNFSYDITNNTLTTSPTVDYILGKAYPILTDINNSGTVLVSYSGVDYTVEIGLTSFDEYQNNTINASVTSLVKVPSPAAPNMFLNENDEVSGFDPWNDNILFFASEVGGIIILDPLDVQSNTKIAGINDSGMVIGNDSAGNAMVWGNVGISITDLTVVPSDPVPVGTEVLARASFTGSLPESSSAKWNWGDESTIDIDGLFTDGDDSITGKHTYSQPGVYSVILEVSDSGGTILATESYQYVIVYDPSAGFVTGGGWFNSPEGAYIDNPDSFGVATFGFVSRYKKGDTVPTGNTSFEFEACGLNFHSTSYDWLVVTGSDYAKFKGMGTIDGWGDYKFMVWAGDDAPDTFRIKIWDELEDTGEDVIYDNGSDQAINGGSILIHAK